MAEDRCTLCGCKMDAHTVMTEDITINGRKGKRPIGWRCPVKPKEWDRSNGS